jgi:hypothetical protein
MKLRSHLLNVLVNDEVEAYLKERRCHHRAFWTNRTTWGPTIGLRNDLG